MRRFLLTTSALVACVAALACRDSPPDPRALARTLASREVPVGIVEPRQGHRYGAIPRLIPTAPVPTLLARFNANTDGFVAVERGGVVHIRHRHEPAMVAELLERPLTFAGPVTHHAWDAVSATVAGVLWSDEGARDSAGSLPSFPVGCPAWSLVHLPVGQTTVRALLDDIVRQRRGLIWLVTYDPYETMVADDLQLGLACPGAGGMVVCSGRATRCGG